MSKIVFFIINFKFIIFLRKQNKPYAFRKIIHYDINMINTSKYESKVGLIYSSQINELNYAFMYEWYQNKLQKRIFH